MTHSSTSHTVTPRADGAPATPVPSTGRYRFGLLAAVATYLAIQAFSTVPSPLYPGYAARDHLSALMITMIYAAYAIGVAASLVLAGHLSDEWGRRPIMIAALIVNVASCVVFIVAPSLPGLFAARILCGLAVGVTASTATAYLQELFTAHRPPEQIGRLRILTSAAALGGLGLGALISGVVAVHVSQPLVGPYVVMLVIFAGCLLALMAAPETRHRTSARPPYRPQRISVPAHARGAFAASLTGIAAVFAIFGLFVGLAGTVLSRVMHEHSMQLSGLVLFALFGAGALATAVAVRRENRRVVQIAGVGLATGLALFVVSLWLPTPSLALLVVAGVIIGIGGACLFTASLSVATSVAPRSRVAETLAGFFLAGYLGISLPVIGTGIALQYLSVRVTLLGFAIVLILGLAAALPKLGAVRMN